MLDLFEGFLDCGRLRLRSSFRNGEGKDRRIAFRREWEAHFPIHEENTAIVQMKSEFSLSQDLAVQVTEDRQQNPALLKKSCLAPAWTPIDVEVAGELRILSVFQHIHPPRVFLAGHHVIGDDVQQETHSVVFEFLDERLKFFFGSKFGVTAHRIGDIVPMRTAFARPESWRGIQVGDPEPMKIGNQLFGIDTTDIQAELHAIGRTWNWHRLLDAHRKKLTERAESIGPLLRLLLTLASFFHGILAEAFVDEVVAILNLPKLHFKWK